MLLKTAKYLNIIIVLLVIMDMVGAVFTILPIRSETYLSYHSKHSSASGIAFIIFENEAKEETEKNEEEREKFIGAELVDFSQVAVLLSDIHTSSVHCVPYEQEILVGSPLFTLHCVFLI